MDDWQKEQAEKPHDQLIGTPLVVIAEKEIPHDDITSSEERPKAITFIEVHRLLNLIQKIDNDTAVIPKDSIICNGLELQENLLYKGLTADESYDLLNYYHLVPSESPLKSNVVGKTGTINIAAFLDSLSEDKPKGLWAITYNPCKSVTLLRNLQWEGYFSFVVTDKPIYGGCYWGYGQPEDDLVFMI